MKIMRRLMHIILPCYWCGDPATGSVEDAYGYRRAACESCR